LSTVQRVAKNTGITIAGEIIFRIISLVVILYLARYLGTVGFGKYCFVFAYLAFFGIVADLGLQPILVREMARDKSNIPKLIGNAFIIRSILTIFAVILSMIVISFMSYPTDTTTCVYIAAFTVLFMSFSDFYSTIFQANLRMEYNQIAKLAFKVLSAGLIIWIIFSKGSLTHIMIALVFSEMVKTSLNYVFSKKFVKPQFEIDFGLWKHLFKEALPIALSSVIWVIYFHIDVVMLSMMIGDAEVGLYSAAYKLSEPLSLIPYALVISLFPIMSASFKDSKERLITTYGHGVRYLLIITLPIAIGTTLLADKIIFLIYGAEFEGSTIALQILIWALVFTSINSVSLHLLVAINQQKLSTICITLCAIVNVILNLSLIPMLSYKGAAIATVVTKIVISGASFYFVSKFLPMLPLHKIVIKPVIGGLIMAAFVYFININILLIILLAGVVYLTALLALKTFTKDDWDIVKRILNL